MSQQDIVQTKISDKMKPSSVTGQTNIYSSQSNLNQISASVEDQEDVRSINLRKRKKSDQDYFKYMNEEMIHTLKELINKEIGEIKNQNSKILESNTQIIKLLEINAANYKELNNKMLILENKHKEATERISELEKQLNGIHKQIIKNTLEIRNLPKTENENLQEVVNTIYKTLNLEQIDGTTKIYRKGKNNGSILIEYQDYKKKDALLKTFKKYNSENKDKPLCTDDLGAGGNNSRVYISEPLTQLSKKIFKAARELVNNGLYKYCWTSRGNVLLRKEEGHNLIVVKSLSQIKDLLLE